MIRHLVLGYHNLSYYYSYPYSKNPPSLSLSLKSRALAILRLSALFLGIWAPIASELFVLERLAFAGVESFKDLSGALPFESVSSLRSLISINAGVPISAAFSITSHSGGRSLRRACAAVLASSAFSPTGYRLM